MYLYNLFLDFIYCIDFFCSGRVCSYARTSLYIYSTDRFDTVLFHYFEILLLCLFLLILKFSV